MMTGGVREEGEDRAGDGLEATATTSEERPPETPDTLLRRAGELVTGEPPMLDDRNGWLMLLRGVLLAVCGVLAVAAAVDAGALVAAIALVRVALADLGRDAPLTAAAGGVELAAAAASAVDSAMRVRDSELRRLDEPPVGAAVLGVC